MIAIEQRPLSPIALDVLEGLSRTPKTLPPKLFYDAAGSALFDEITRLREYYLTRTELAIFERYATEILIAAGPNVTVVELGAGSATKTRTLLRALASRQLKSEYFPVDLSPAPLHQAKISIERELPMIRVQPLVADFAAGFAFVRRAASPRLVLYIGSSIGNLEPNEAVEMLKRLRAELDSGDALLLGTDMVKPESVLIPAYDDVQGVTARFNKNVLVRINRELGGDFDLEQFRHVARWNAQQSRIEMHLESLCEQVVRVDCLRKSYRFAAGETIHTENSYKYTIDSVAGMLREAGFTLEQTWFDDRRWFSVHLARI